MNENSLRRVAICKPLRTPVGKFLGSLAPIEAGELGEIRQLQCDYVQGHLARMSDAEVAGEDWHMQAAVAGESLILGDIATHAFHMLEYVSGLSTREVSADVVAVVPKRTAHDNANLMLRYTNGARGMMWITQAAAGAEHVAALDVTQELVSEPSALGCALDQPR